MVCSAQPDYQASSRAEHSTQNLNLSAPTLPPVSPDSTMSNMVMSSGVPLIYHDWLLKSYTGGTIRQSDDRFFSL